MEKYNMSSYCKNCYELIEQLHRYKQEIEEIKEIAEKIYKAYEICYFGCDSCEAKQIIQKCEGINNGNN